MMTKINLNKALAAGIFAVTIMAISACGGSGGGSSAGVVPKVDATGDATGGTSIPGTTKISTIAGGGSSTTTTDPTQATLGFAYNIVAKGDGLVFTSTRDGTVKLQTLNLATNQLSTAAYSGIGAGENVSALLASSAAKYYLTANKTIGTGKAYMIYEANSALAAIHKAGKNDVATTGFVENTNGLLGTFSFPRPHGVIYNDGANDQLFFIDAYKIRKVILSGNYPTSTVNAASTYESERIALKGDKLIVTAPSNSIIFEYDLKNTTGEKIIAGSSSGYLNAETPLQARINLPINITTSPAGNIYFTVAGVTGSGQKIVRKLAVNNGVYGAVTTTFGAEPGSAADSVEINSAYDIEFVGNNLYVLDSGADSTFRIKKIEFINQTP